MSLMLYADMKEEPYVIRTSTNKVGSTSIIMSIPKTLANKYGIKVHTNLIATDTGKGILLSKLKVE